jgi:hypothetical protein
MDQFGLKYTYTWKKHKESPCIAILTSNYQNHVFLIIFYVFSATESENKRADRFCLRQGGGGGCGGGEMGQKPKK